MKHCFTLLIVFLISVLIMTGCGDDTNQAEEDHQQPEENENEGAPESEANGEDATEEAAPEDAETIQIGYNNWAENIAVSNMWKILLEEEGYDVELVNLEKSGVFTGVASGDLDIGMEVWIPFTDQHYVDEFGDDFEVQEAWYENTELGLVVPEYVEEVNSIDDLVEHEDLFDNTIVGIDPGASLMELTEEVIDEVPLDYELLSSSDSAMMAELDVAYENEEPIVVTLWSPHWAFASYDLKYLDDPEGMYGEADDIVFITREGFEDEYSDVLEWMNEWHMDDDSLGSLMGLINEMDDPVEGAQSWIDDNQELIGEWIQ